MAAAPRVLLYVRIRLGAVLRRKMEPEDVLQETYAAALAVLDRFEDRGDDFLVRWLCRIAETTIRAAAEREGAAKRTPPAEAQRLTRIPALVHDSEAAEMARRHNDANVLALSGDRLDADRAV
ncbi:MAG: RpiB/LacA/LacB family sugar-phosphate isomerase, partial [Planctomycetota bacterium]